MTACASSHLFLVLVAASAWSADEPVASGPVVLITAFKPFAQRKVNGSETVAEALRKDLPGVQVKVLVLEVGWKEPSAKLPLMAQKLRPRVLIGLGEGAVGSVMVEQVAHNYRVGPDVFGQPPADRLVERGGPLERRSTLAFNTAWQLSREIAVASSDDAGDYLCNALFYTALGDLGVAVERVGFVHLPPQGNEDDKDYSDRFVPILRELIERNL
ncbi:MAG: hypothetical protein H0W78_14335 [Planctomycetes bacterium]|nr:hypothetical protein [Planctomycetota bacterium]